MERSKKSGLLIGVMIGLYSNWLIAVVEKLENTDLLPIMLFALSFLPFILYFREIFTEIEEQHLVKWMPLKTILGFIYVLIVYFSLWFSDLVFSESLFSTTGIVLWIMLMQVERRELI